MANVNIKFNGKEFLLSCDDGQEEHLEELAIHLNQKFDDLKSNLGNIGENKLLLITSIKIMDEYFETKKFDQRTHELNELKLKFKELKSLIYDYKNKKENEIFELNKFEKDLKSQIDENKSEYEKILDEATEKIENFLKKRILTNLCNKQLNKSFLRSKSINTRKIKNKNDIKINSSKVMKILKKFNYKKKKLLVAIIQLIMK